MSAANRRGNLESISKSYRWTSVSLFPPTYKHAHCTRWIKCFRKWAKRGGMIDHIVIHPGVQTYDQNSKRQTNKQYKFICTRRGSTEIGWTIIYLWPYGYYRCVFIIILPSCHRRYILFCALTSTKMIATHLQHRCRRDIY